MSKPILDKLLNGESVKTLMKTFFKDIDRKNINVDKKLFECPACGRNFNMERAMKSHVTKIHKKKEDKSEPLKPKSVDTLSDSDSTLNDTDKTVLECTRCLLKTANKTNLKKHNKKVHNSVNRVGSPAKKKQKLAEDLSKGIVEDILNQIHDKYESMGETNEELKKLETVSYEENRVDQQIMDFEKVLSNRNNQKILDKHKKEAAEDLLRQAEIT